MKFRKCLNILLVVFASLNSCKNKDHASKIDHIQVNDSVLSFEIFKQIQQVYLTENEVFLLYDLYKDGSVQYDLQLLVCGNELKLKKKFKSPLFFITKCQEDSIYGLTNNSQNKANFNEEALQYVFVLKDLENGFQKEKHTIIDSLTYIPRKFKVKLYTRVSDNLYAWPGEKEYLKKTEYYSSLFSRSEVLEIPISSIYFPRYDKNVIALIENRRNNYILNEMNVVNKKCMNKMFNDIYSDLIKH